MNARVLAATAIAFGSLALGSVGRAGADGVRLIGLAENNILLRFTSTRPSEVTQVEVGGASGTVLGIDVRPADGRLYGVTTSNDLYQIDAASGVARLVSTLTAAFDGSPHCGVDFNPQADRLRLVAESGQNLRVHADLGAVAVDGALAYVAGDRHAGVRPRIAAAAYTKNVRAAPDTRLFDIDFRLDVLALQDPPNDGGLRTVGPLGIDFEPRGGFDIVTGPDGGETGFAASGGVLYRIDLATGAAAALGTIGDGRGALIGLAVESSGPTSPAAAPHPGAPAARMMGAAGLGTDQQD